MNAHVDVFKNENKDPELVKAAVAHRAELLRVSGEYWKGLTKMIKIDPNGEIYLNESKLDYFVGVSTSTGRRPLCRMNYENPRACPVVSGDVSALLSDPSAIYRIITGVELRRFNSAGSVRNGRARTLYLDDSTIARAKTIGGGSASDGIRKAIEGFKL